ncbi:MAG TPA: [Fe-Fe] hydrogenase large subunit C-terminal domain-containing protein, partial [Kiritimatiellia bacterium]|nr:[Fe-Fe] hydrogenase large subunit C-terminal domain-containing protein [Kiritimatiellia bacterium]HQQ03957.1 [Fe-Fe] hydrogenase large subunit C-terminal domain-containing protein [Kiritimatiellia bacterium]
YVEQNYPEFMGNLSTCKSPQQMMGAVIKSYFAEKMGLSPKKIFSVSIMPCTAKKFEATRSEMGTRSIPDIDAVLTTREFIRMIRMSGLDLNDLEPDTADTPFGERSTAGKLFGASGGVMEAAVRTAHYLLTGRELKVMALEAVRGMKDRKEAQLEINGMKIGIAVVNGLGGAKPLLDEIRAGRDDLHFIEVMTCPGGCINGGGQPIDMNMDAVKARMAALYQLDAKARLRTSHSNPSIMRIYKEFLGDPLGPVSHRLLHTKYMERKVLN